MRMRMVLVLIEKGSPSSNFHLDPAANFDLQAMVVMMREVVEKDEKDEAESLGLSGLQAHPIHFLSPHNTFISSLPSPSYKLPPLPSL